MSWCRDAPDGLLLDVMVQPRASRERVGPLAGDRLKLSVTAPPVDGAANEAVIRLLASCLGLRRSAITIHRGRTGRKKTLAIRGLDAETLRRKVPS